MDGIRIHSLALLILIVAIFPETESQRQRPLPIPLRPPVIPRPLCATQFALVNYACAALPYSPAPPLPPPPPPSPPTPTPPSPPVHREESHHRHREQSHHRHRAPKHGNRHRHSHRYVGDHEVTPEEDNCCRWLKDVDTECVCDVLVHLPIFLAKPVHEYTVIVNSACNVTFPCGGRLRP